MLTLITETEHAERQHLDKLKDLMKQTDGIVRIASAYVTDTQILSNSKDRDTRLLTYISRMDIITGASSLKCLIALVNSGVQCSYLSEGPRLHAKVYIFDNKSAVVTSANLTRRALIENLEVGVQVSGLATAQLISWFDVLWKKAEKLDLATLDKWHQTTEVERAQYSAMRKMMEKQPPLPTSSKTKLVDVFQTENRFFVCNTNRKYSREDEKLMHDRGYAAAWENFNFLSHMQRVEQGHVIFMYAKGFGIIGVGQAKGQCQMLEAGDPDRVTPGITREWRVPTDWLAWKHESDAHKWNSPNSTFFEVSGDQYKSLRNEILTHFSGIS